MNIETMSAADLRKPIADMEAELEGKTSGMTVEKLRRKARNLREELAAPPPVYLSDEDAAAIRIRLRLAAVGKPHKGRGRQQRTMQRLATYFGVRGGPHKLMRSL
jgi:hypothetical protein